MQATFGTLIYDAKWHPTQTKAELQCANAWRSENQDFLPKKSKILKIFFGASRRFLMNMHRISVEVNFEILHKFPILKSFINVHTGNFSVSIFCCSAKGG